MVNVAKAKNRREYVYLIFSVAVTLGLLYFFYDLNPLFTVAITILGLFYIRLLQGQYLGNALQVSSRHFYRIKQLVEDQAHKLRIPEPYVFIHQDPNPNAYTLGFKHPYTIVLTSSLIEALTEEELEAVMAHEMGHAKFHHPRIGSIVSPAGNSIFVFTWIFSFWQRAAEISADNVSLIVSENPRALVTALTKIGIGPNLFHRVDEEELLAQSQEIRKNRLNKMGEWLNTHPYLTSRINNILSLSKRLDFKYAHDGEIHCTHCGKKISVAAKFCPKCGKKT